MIEDDIDGQLLEHFNDTEKIAEEAKQYYLENVSDEEIIYPNESQN